MSRVGLALRLLVGGAVVGVIYWLGSPRVAEARSAREVIAREMDTAVELEHRLRLMAAARDLKTDLAGELAAGRRSLRVVTDEYLLLDAACDAVLPHETDTRWRAARSALVRARDHIRRLPEPDRSAARTRLLTAFADEFPDHPLSDWP